MQQTNYVNANRFHAVNVHINKEEEKTDRNFHSTHHSQLVSHKHTIKSIECEWISMINSE